MRGAVGPGKPPRPASHLQPLCEHFCLLSSDQTWPGGSLQRAWARSSVSPVTHMLSCLTGADPRQDKNPE